MALGGGRGGRGGRGGASGGGRGGRRGDARRRNRGATRIQRPLTGDRPRPLLMGRGRRARAVAPRLCVPCIGSGGEIGSVARGEDVVWWRSVVVSVWGGGGGGGGPGRRFWWRAWREAW